MSALCQAEAMERSTKTRRDIQIDRPEAVVRRTPALEGIRSGASALLVAKPRGLPLRTGSCLAAAREPSRPPPPHRRGARSPRAPSPGQTRFRRRRGLHLARRHGRARARCARQPRRHRAPARDRPGARPSGREHRALRARPSRQQCAAVGRARHGQVVAGQGCARLDQPRERGRGAPETGRDPSRGHRGPARAHGPFARRALSVHRLLRRPFVRRRRHVLQVAQSRARGRNRRAPGERALLRDLEPAPPSCRAT